MMNEADTESLGKVIAALSERVAIGILMEATKEDYLTELDDELDELAEAVRMLEMLKFPIPAQVEKVFYWYIEAFLDAAKE